MVEIPLPVDDILLTVLVGVIVGGHLAVVAAAIVRARILREPLPLRAWAYIGVIVGAAGVWLTIRTIIPIVSLFR